MPLVGLGQTELARLFVLLQEDQTDSAYVYCKSVEGKNYGEDSTQFMMLQAFVCKDMYKKHRELNSKYRVEGIETCRRVLASEQTEYHQKTTSLLRFFASTCYNDLVVPYGQWVENDGEHDVDYFKDWDGSTIMLLPVLLETNIVQDQSKVYNIGALLYNEGVDIILNLASDAPIEDLLVAQERAVTLFKAAHPFLAKYYEATGNGKEQMDSTDPDKFEFWKDQEKFWEDFMKDKD